MSPAAMHSSIGFINVFTNSIISRSPNIGFEDELCQIAKAKSIDEIAKLKIYVSSLKSHWIFVKLCKISRRLYFDNWHKSG